MKQQILLPAEQSALDAYFSQLHIRRLFCVCGTHVHALSAGRYFDTLEARTGIQTVLFSGFAPNPDYTQIAAGVRMFRESGCDAVCGIGGGSAMDTAKCIKLFARMPDTADYVAQEIVPNSIPLIAVPTTAGSGSESTRYAVIYYHGSKLSVTHESCIPDAVIFAPALLYSLPEKQKKATAMDALCHAVESLWSVHANAESTDFAVRAIRLLLPNLAGYLANDPAACAKMLQAANLAGQAINITATTAGHAMCYRLTVRYGMPHGAAAALCTERLFAQMTGDLSGAADPKRLRAALETAAEAMGCPDAAAASSRFTGLTEQLGIFAPDAMQEADLDDLAAAVNVTRLANHPVLLGTDAIRALYAQMLTRRDEKCS